MEIKEVPKIRINETDIFLENFEIGKGKITISNTDWGYNMSCYWGAMGENTTLEMFLKQINASYFVDKLLSREEEYEFDSKKTFAAVRWHIKNEILPWYKHMEFQKDMRERLREFQQECADERWFVENFSYFMSNLNYYLIEDSYAREELKNELTSIEEPWSFICTKYSRKAHWLMELHKQLKKKL